MVGWMQDFLLISKMMATKTEYGLGLTVSPLNLKQSSHATSVVAAAIALPLTHASMSMVQKVQGFLITYEIAKIRV